MFVLFFWAVKLPKAFAPFASLFASDLTFELSILESRDSNKNSGINIPSELNRELQKFHFVDVFLSIVFGTG